MLSGDRSLGVLCFLIREAGGGFETGGPFVLVRFIVTRRSVRCSTRFRNGVRIIAFPHRGIAYTDSFYEAVERRGLKVVAGDWSGRWLRDNLTREDIVHIHWPSFLYSDPDSVTGSAKGFLRFAVLLALMRLRSKEIWWTAHNLLPHVRCAIPFLDVWARHLMIAAAARVFVHGEHAEAVLLERFPGVSGKCIRIPHGNWVGRYEPQHTRESARLALELPQDAFIHLFFGQCKPYKNLDGLLRIFLQEASDREMLLVAGRFADAGYLARIRELARDDPRVRIDARFIRDSEVSSYVAASDVMCIPYREILTSGTAMLALSFGKPVISIDRGFLREVVTPETGVLVPPGDDRALAEALRVVKERSWSREAILRQAGRFRFEDAAQISIDAASPAEHLPRAGRVALSNAAGDRE